MGFKMKKILSVIIGLAVAAALAGCRDDVAGNSVPAPTTSFDPSVFVANETSTTTYPSSSDFKLPITGDPFTNDEILELAKKQFQSIYGFLPEVEIMYEDENSIYIHIFDYYNTDEPSDTIQIQSYDVYFINKKSATGQTSSGDFIDLTAYI